MGWCVIAFGYIDTDIENTEKILTKMKEIGKEDFCKLQGKDGHISFEMEGNKGIDYDSLEKLRDWIKKEKLSCEISTSGYVEGSDGFYFNSEDEE